MALNIDPQFEKIIPPLSDSEYASLEESLINEGCRDPLVVWNSTIIDGHNRYKICLNNNVDYAFITKDFDSKNEVMLWMINNQFARRNISTYVRCELALRLKDFYSEIAKENQIRKPSDSVSQNSVEQKPIDTQKEIATKANISHDTINKVERIKKALEDTPNAEIEEKLKTGEVSINNAFQQVVKKIFKLIFIPGIMNGTHRLNT